jgi:hypothetical protein
MEKGCGSTIWRTYKSEVRGKPERVRRDDPTNPWVELSRKTCSNGPRSRNTRPIFLSRKRQGGARKAAVAYLRSLIGRIRYSVSGSHVVHRPTLKEC